MALFKRFFQFFGRHKIMTAAMVLAIIGAAGFGVFWTNQNAIARDNSDNAIVRGGTATKQEVKTEVFGQSKRSKQHSDLKSIFSAYGIKSESDVDKLVEGKVTKKGEVIVNGQVVGTDAKSIGRHNIHPSTKKNISGAKTSIYERSTSTSFLSNELPAFVLLDDNGQAKSAFIKDCGNPTSFKPKKPVYTCDMLNMKAGSEKDSYVFSTKATAKEGAKITKVVYDFGDGNTKEESNPSKEVAHKYSKPGNYKAKVTVHFEVNGKKKTHTSKSCEKEVKVAEPPKPVYECKQLAAAVVPPSKNKFSFTATARAENGATLQSGSFDFGDSNTQNDVAANGTTVTTEHEYAQTGSYTATVTLKFNIGETTKEVKCSTPVNPEIPQPVYECTGLEMTQISRTKYDFKASSHVENAELTGYRYVVSGAGSAEQQLGPNDTFSFTAETPGSYNVQAFAIVTVNGETKETPASDACAKQFTVEEAPVAECTSLIAQLRDGTRNTYDYTVEVNLTGDAQVVDYAFDFGDGSEVQTTTEPTTSHTYAADGEYTTTVTVKFTVEGNEVSSQCQVATPVAPEPPENCPIPGKEEFPVGSPECEEEPKEEECIPGVPVGDPRCEKQPEENPCPYPGKEDLPADSDECEETPTVLPATGAAGIIGGAVALSSLVGAGYSWQASRKELAARFRK